MRSTLGTRKQNEWENLMGSEAMLNNSIGQVVPLGLCQLLLAEMMLISGLHVESCSGPKPRLHA